MVTPVYSTLLGEANAVPNTGGPFELGAVPAGFVWVVRSVVAFNLQAWPLGLGGLQLLDNLGAVLWAVGKPEARSQKLYSSTVHQTMTTFDRLSAVTPDTGWTIRVSGFQLIAP